MNTVPDQELKPASELKIFISSRSADYLIAEKIKKWIKGANRNVHVTAGGTDLRAGSEWYPKLKDDLKEANVLVAIYQGDDGRGGYEWVYQESGIFVRVDKPDEPVITLYAGPELPAPLQPYQGFSMRSLEGAQDFLDALFVGGLGGYEGVNAEAPDIAYKAAELVEDFAAGRTSPLGSFATIMVVLDESAEPVSVTGTQDAMDIVGKLGEDHSWSAFTEYHRKLPSATGPSPGGWISDLEHAFRLIQRSDAFDQPTQTITSAKNQRMYLPRIQQAQFQGERLRSIDVLLVDMPKPVDMGGPIFMILIDFERLKHEFIVTLNGVPEEQDWKRAGDIVGVADALLSDIKERSAGLLNSSPVRIDQDAITELLEFVSDKSEMTAAVSEAVKQRDGPALRMALAEFEEVTMSTWQRMAGAYHSAVSDVERVVDREEGLEDQKIANIR